MMNRFVFATLLFFVFVSNLTLIAEEKPNIVIVMTDDQGYADAGCYGAQGFKTPNLDRLAVEGRRFTNFYAGATICSPSRASLLTGCYPDRVGIVNFVFFPTHGENPGVGPNGLHPNEITIAEMLKEQGYTTACVGKWHLGDAKPFLPTNQGFDEYFGLPYSNDMQNGANPPNKGIKKGFPPLPLYDGETIIETDPDQHLLTQRYTERAVDFIKRNKNKPFFLYVPHSMPHIPLHVHPDFAGKSEQGLYGDVIQEIDWSVGQILQTIKDCNIDEKTWVIFTSDNGPWLTMGNHGGKAIPLRDGKQTKYDGGHKVLCLMRYPGKIKPNTIGTATVSSIDLFPTIAKLCGGKIPDNRKIDGVEAWDYFSGNSEQSPRETYFYNGQVVRHGKWKLFLPGNYLEFQPENLKNQNVKYDKPRLFDLDADVGETNDVSEQHPETVAVLTKLLEEYREDLKKNSRPLGINTKMTTDTP
ncbi:MAG: sulfatase [Planctomycetaceae bacterium]|jgi:arylsulfatase|nr:sulfatase [Planctomycetaceae bacterium]